MNLDAFCDQYPKQGRRGVSRFGFEDDSVALAVGY
jgi:hypothetical protein